MAIVELAAEVRELSQLVMTGRRSQALTFVHAVVRRGVAPATVIEQLLVPVERTIGAQWELARLDTAPSIAATAIVEEALDTIVASTPHRGGRGAVLVACPPGGWHSLPARIVGALLGFEGWDAAPAGASTSADALVAKAHDAGARVVALSCSMPTTLISAADVVAVLHAAGIAVVVGGAGFGADGRRAAAIGADAWCVSAALASRVLDEWTARPPRLRASVDVDLSVGRLDDVTRAGITDSALRIIGRTMPGELRALVGTRLDANDLARVLDLVAVAFLTGDETVVSDELVRLRRFLEVRRIPASVVDAGVTALADASPPGPVRTLLLEASRAASPPAGDAAPSELVPALPS